MCICLRYRTHPMPILLSLHLTHPIPPCPLPCPTQSFPAPNMITEPYGGLLLVCFSPPHHVITASQLAINQTTKSVWQSGLCCLAHFFARVPCRCSNPLPCWRASCCWWMRSCGQASTCGRSRAHGTYPISPGPGKYKRLIKLSSLGEYYPRGRGREGHHPKRGHVHTQQRQCLETWVVWLGQRKDMRCASCGLYPTDVGHNGLPAG